MYEKLPFPTHEYVPPSNCPLSNKPPARLGNGTTTLDPAAVPKPSENFPFHFKLDKAGAYTFILETERHSHNV